MRETKRSREANAILLGALAFAGSLGLGARPAQAQPVGSEFEVNTHVLEYQGSPAVAPGSSGGFVVAWHGYPPASAYSVFARRFTISAAPLTDDFRVNTHTTNKHQAAAIASDSSGNFVVAWVSFSQDGSGYGVYAQRYSSDGSAVDGEFRVNTNTTGYQSYPSIAPLAAGGFVVVWNTNAFRAGAAIAGQRFDASGQQIGGEFRVDTYTVNVATHPKIASDAAGDFVVVWTSTAADASLGAIAAQRFSHTGAPLGTEFLVNTYTTNDQTDAAVASDAQGNFAVVWSSNAQDGSGLGVFGQLFAKTGAPLGGEFRVNTTTTGAQKQPTVTRSPAGDFVVAWATPVGILNQIYARRYNADGVPVDAQEFQASTSPVSDKGPNAAYLAQGGFVIAWTSNDPYGTSYNVSAQQFACGVRGDVNASGAVDVADIFYLINTLFASGPQVVCSGDVDRSGTTDVADVFYLINYLFAGGPAPL
jgi:hypothetical protein